MEDPKKVKAMEAVRKELERQAKENELYYDRVFDRVDGYLSIEEIVTVVFETIGFNWV